MVAVRRFFARPRNVLLSIALVGVAAAGTFAAVRRPSIPDFPTSLVTRGEFVDTLEIRGEIRPLKSVVLSSPMQSGELQILKLAKSGTMVKPGARGFGFNADATMLVRFLEVGTKVDVRD